MSIQSPFSPPRSQRGASLVIALVILVVMAMLGFSAMTMSNATYKQAGNLQFQAAAFDQAEAAVAAATVWLTAPGNAGNAGFDAYDAGATPFLYPIDYLADNAIELETMTWTNGNSLALDGAGAQRYVIEKVADDRQLAGSSLAIGGLANNGACNRIDIYRITARGTSARGALKFIQTNHSVLNC